VVRLKLWPAQITAIRNLEASLAQNKPRALIQMATGSGKTFTAISFIYRLIKFAGVRRVLFLVDRGNLGRQAKKEFDAVRLALQQLQVRRGVHRPAPHQQPARHHGARLHQHHPAHVQHAQGPRAGRKKTTSAAPSSVESLFKDRSPSPTTRAFPIETFDLIVTDEAHRSIYNLWRQVLEYFDAHLVGLTATPNKQTFGFFNQNLVMEYGHPQAVADGVNVNYDVYRIRTEVSEQGSTGGSRLLAGNHGPRHPRKARLAAGRRLRLRRRRAGPQGADARPDPHHRAHAARPLAAATSFPQRQELPKTLVFAKDDNHAEKIVEILREELGPRQRVRAEDHLPHHGRQAGRPDQGLPHQLLPARGRHRGHDRHRHRHQAGGDRRVHAQREEPQLLRADEGPRRARHQGPTTCAA
jgi:type I restriction enzyme R subunit